MPRTANPDTPQRVVLPTDVPTGAPDGDLIQQAIQSAHDLIAAKKDIQSRLQVSRDWLHGVVVQGLGTPEQRDWITTNLPKRTRGENGDSADAE